MSGCENEKRCGQYLQLLKFQLLACKVVKPHTALLYNLLYSTEAVLKRLSTGLKIFHLRHKILKRIR